MRNPFLKLNQRLIALGLAAISSLPVQAQVTQPVSETKSPQVGSETPKLPDTNAPNPAATPSTPIVNPGKNLAPGSPIPVFPIPVSGTSAAPAAGGKVAQ